jgi:hypothetical protein
MEIKTYSPAEQVDPAVDLGVVAPPLPEILNLRQLVETATAAAAADYRGVLHQGLQDDPRRHQQEQQVVVPARPGSECGQR